MKTPHERFLSRTLKSKVNRGELWKSNKNQELQIKVDKQKLEDKMQLFLNQIINPHTLHVLISGLKSELKIDKDQFIVILEVVGNDVKILYDNQKYDTFKQEIIKNFTLISKGH